MRGIRTYLFYLGKRTLFGIAGLFLVIWMLVVSIDLIEAMREVGKVEDAGFSEALRMTLFRTPQLILTLSPFVFLFGTLWAFAQMSKSSEVAVFRAAGLSVWRIVAAPVVLSVALGFLTVAALDPVAANLAGRAQTIKNEMRGKQTNLIEAFREGVWLRQAHDGVTTIFRADSYDPVAQTLSEVTVWRRTTEGEFIERWDAPLAVVSPTNFTLRDAKRTTIRAEADPPVATRSFAVDIDLRALREDVARPSSLSVWQLPEFAEIMSSAGMPTQDYLLRYHDLWSLPVKLMAMVLIACAVALGINSRSGGTPLLIAIGIAAGFALFIMAQLSTAIARAQIVPIALAAWAPGILAVMVAVTMLLYREDG